MKKVILICFTLLFSALSAYVVAEPALIIDSAESPRAKLLYVRFKSDDEKGWLIRGRVTRADKNIKVPEGIIKAVAVDQQGNEIQVLTSGYNPLFVHRKTDRASYFTVSIPQALMNKASSFVVSHEY